MEILATALIIIVVVVVLLLLAWNEYADYKWNKVLQKIKREQAISFKRMSEALNKHEMISEEQKRTALEFYTILLNSHSTNTLLVREMELLQVRYNISPLDVIKARKQ